MRTSTTQPPLGISLNKSHSLTKTLVGYFPFNEGGGQKVFNKITGKSNSVSGTTVFKQDTMGNCILFNGTNSYINVDAISTSSVFTYVAWVKTSSLTTQNIVIGQNSGSGGPTFRVNSNLTLSLLKRAVATIGTSTSAINSGVFNHVAGTYNLAGDYAIYINGVLSGSGTNLQTFTFSSFIIGSANGVAEFFNGTMNNVMIYDRVLLATEIRQLYINTYQMYQTARPLKIAV